jgi:hemolysin activation/secretion protein
METTENRGKLHLGYVFIIFLLFEILYSSLSFAQINLDARPEARIEQRIENERKDEIRQKEKEETERVRKKSLAPRSATKIEEEKEGGCFILKDESSINLSGNTIFSTKHC